MVAWSRKNTVTFAIAGAGIAIGWLIQRNGQSRHAESPDMPATSHLTRPAPEAAKPATRPRKYAPLVLCLILMLLTASIGWVLFQSANSSAPSRPQFATGGLLVFTDQPHEKVAIVANVSKDGYFSLSVSSQNGGRFIVVSSGSAALDVSSNPFRKLDITEIGPDFIPRVRVATLQDVGPNPAVLRRGVFTQPLTDHDYNAAIATYEIANLSGSSQSAVAAGNIFTGEEDIPGNLSVLGKFRNSVVNRTASIEIGQLPLIGVATSMKVVMPGSVSSEPITSITLGGSLTDLSRNLGLSGPITGSVKWYSPDATVHISIVSTREDILSAPYESSSNISPAYNLDSAQPPTVSSQELQWNGSGSLKAGWQLTNVSAVRSDSVKLFFAGLLLGAAISFLGLALDRALP